MLPSLSVIPAIPAMTISDDGNAGVHQSSWAIGVYFRN